MTFITYDAIAVLGRHSVHRCSVLSASYTNSFLVALLTTFGVTVSTTLLAPYAMTAPHDNTALVSLFDIRGIVGMRYIIIVGAVAGLLATIITCVSASAKLLQNISEDGLLLPLFSKLFRTQPIASLATIAALSSAISLVFDLNFLLNIIGSGALIGSMGVAACVLILRFGTLERLPIEQFQLQNELSREQSMYSFTAAADNQNYKLKKVKGETTELLNLDSKDPRLCRATEDCAKRIYGATKKLSVDYVNDSYVSNVASKSTDNRYYAEIEDAPSVSTSSVEAWKTPTPDSSRKSRNLVVTSTILIVLFSGVAAVLPSVFNVPLWYSYLTDVIVCLLLGVLICVLIALYKKPRFSLDPEVVLYKTPCIPLLPVCVLWTNAYLLTSLSFASWAVQLVLLLLGKFRHLEQLETSSVYVT